MPCSIAHIASIPISQAYQTALLRQNLESQISRIKRCIGARLLTRRLESQQCEGVIIANLLNLWNAFGRPVCVKNA
ncbi:hypothetical protein [Burkholderia ubonensis]|uniref:hypothetical protein n=1 Tax=Burkholderia ubonensis TaxID=101571 RepID=UPI001E650489|nr:hypothetical protein [Burkholderia ubonensis]